MMSCVQCDTGPYRSLRAMTEPVVPGENGELVGTSQARAAQAASHSCSSTGLRARKLMPCVPNSAALLA